MLAIVKDNTRLPVECEGDIYSLANCNEIGARRLVEMLDEFGLEDIEGSPDHVVDSSREAVLAVIAGAAQGDMENTMTVDGYDEPRPRGEATIREDGISVDYEGTSARRAGINVPATYTAAYTMFGLASALGPRCRTMPARSRPSRWRRRPRS